MSWSPTAAHLALLQARGVHAVLRVHQRQIVDFTPRRAHVEPGKKVVSQGLPRSRWLSSLGRLDQVVEWFKPKEKLEWMKEADYAALPKTLVVRELRYEIRRPGFRTRKVILVTTLLDDAIYSEKALADLYYSRRDVETNLKHLKQTMKMDILKCKHSYVVLKELMVYAMVYNLVRLIMSEASRRQDIAVERISFIDALRWLLDAKPGDELLPLKVNLNRFGRVEPQVRKRRPKQFPVMQKPRPKSRKQLLDNSLTD